MLRGLASNKSAMRESCAVGLASMVERTSFLKALDFVRLIDEHLMLKRDVSEKVRGQSESVQLLERRSGHQGYGDVCTGRALAFSVCMRLKHHKESRKSLEKVISGLLDLYSKPDMGEICAGHLAEILVESGHDTVQELFEKHKALKDLCLKPSSHAAANDVLFCLKAWGVIPTDVLQECIVLPQTEECFSMTWTTETGFDEKRVPLSEAFFNGDHLEKLLSVLQDSVSTHPRVHSVWDVILELLLFDVDKFSTRPPSSKICSFWTNVIDPLCACSWHKQFLGQKLALRILSYLNASYVPQITKGVHLCRLFVRKEVVVGKCWESIINAFHADIEGLQKTSSACLEQILTITSQSPEKSSQTTQILIACRIPHTEKCKPLKDDLLQAITPEAAVDFAHDQIKNLLKTEKHGERVPDRVQIIKDLQNLLKLSKLDTATLCEIFKSLLLIGLFKFEKKAVGDEDKIVKQIRRARLSASEGLRHQCLSCAMQIYASLDQTALNNLEQHRTETISVLGELLKMSSLPDVQLSRDILDDERPNLAALADLSEFIELSMREEPDEKQKKRMRVIYDLLSVIRVYYLANPETISPDVFDGLGRFVALMFGSTADDDDMETEEASPEAVRTNDTASSESEEEEGDNMETEVENEEAIDVLVTVLIELCARRTDPFSIRLMMKYVRCTFAVFCGDLELPSWIRLIGAIADPDAFDIDHQEEPRASNVDISSNEETDDEVPVENPKEEAPEGDSVSDLNDAFDAAALLEDSNATRSVSKRQAKKLRDDVDCASARVLSLIEHVVRKHSRKEFTLLAPLHLMRALLAREGLENEKSTSISQRLLHVFNSSLACRPELKSENLPPLKSEVEAFLEEEALRKTSYRSQISKAGCFLVTRLMHSAASNEDCRDMALDILRASIDHQIGKRLPIIHAEGIITILSQYRDLSRAVLCCIVKSGTETKRAHHKLKALEMVNACLNDKDKKATAEAIQGIGVEAFLKQVAETQLSGRLQQEVFQELRKALKHIRKLTEGSPEISLSLDQLKETIDQRTSETTTPKLKRKWSELSKGLATSSVLT